MKLLQLFQLILYPLIFCSYVYGTPKENIGMNPSVTLEANSDTALSHHMYSYAAYNQWANEQFSDWLSGISEELAQKEMVSSFPSIRETLFHLYNAEYGWFSWVKTGEWQSVDDSWKERSTADLWQLLCQKSEEIKNYVKDWEDTDWQKVHERSNGLKMTRAEVFHTVFNHATYHRGQFITMGRQLGLTDPPRTDYVYFLSLK
jgi:uncharacterized damage-inducible protein DinB